MSTKVFRQQDQDAFARLSGDFNPIHVDPVAARRTLFGRGVVHGVHLVLLALNQFCVERGRRLSTLRVVFRSPVLVGDQVEFVRHGDDTIHVSSPQGVCSEIKVQFVPAIDAPQELGEPPRRGFCRTLSVDEAEGLTGSLPLGFDFSLCAELFPALASALPPRQIGAILAMTRIIGMEVPGLHSIFQEIRSEFGSGEIGSEITYRVEWVHKQYRRVSIALKSGELKGTLVASFRPPPKTQASLASLHGLKIEGTLTARRALVIGGSRGLGELGAKLAALAGADVLLTYRDGLDDASQIVDEIRSLPGRAEHICYDVVAPNQKSTRRLVSFAPDVLLYLASPKILPSQREEFDEALFDVYVAYYLAGLARLTRVLLEGRGDKRLATFYPSTIFIDKPEQGYAEYASAKAAGEAFCAQLAHIDRCFFPVIRRLPKLATDQTATITGPVAADPVPAMIEGILALGRQFN